MVLGMVTSYLGTLRIGLVRGEVHVRILKRDEVHRLLSCHIRAYTCVRFLKFHKSKIF
jgi:hypothetical protein